MKSILHLKFIVLYIIFGFLCVFTTATLTNELIMDRLEEDISQSLYREATLISNNYLPSYFSEDSSIWAVQSQLIAMRLYLNSSLWFVAPDGSLITSSNIRGTTAPVRLKILIRPKSGTASTLPELTTITLTRILLLSWHRSLKDSQQRDIC